MSSSGKPKKIVHPRQRPCPDCRARPGEPCVLSTGKPLEDIHCTIRVTGYPVEGTWKPPHHEPQDSPRRAPDTTQNEAATAATADTSGDTGVPNKNAGEVSQTRPTKPLDTSQAQKPEPQTEPPAEPVPEPSPVGTPPDAAPTEPAPASTSTEATPDEDPGAKKDVFDAGSGLFQSAKTRQKKPKTKKKSRKSADAEAEPSLF